MNKLTNRKNIIAVFTLSALFFLANSVAFGQRFSAWSAPVNLGTAINTSALEGCPFIAPDNLSLFFASDRAGGAGGVDIWVSTRANANAPWAVPVNLGTNINTSATEFCPTLIAGGLTLYFVSDKPGGCGGNDIYVSQRPSLSSEWGPAVNLGCQLNSPQSDITPSVVTDAGGTTRLYFSSNRPGGPGMQDIYVSTLQPDGTFGVPVLVAELNTPFNDLRPNVRVSDGLEIFFESNRTGTLGLTDLYVSTRASSSSAWQMPVNLGATVNSASVESRPSLSFDGRDLYFQSNRPGGLGDNDVYVVRRTPFDFCVPTTTVTEGDLAPGGIVSFGVSSSQNSVTVDHVNAGTGLQSLTVVGTATNATVNIPPFTPGTFNPVVITFNATTPGQEVDFTLRAASTFHAANIRVRCRESCTPSTTVTEGDLAPGGIVSFGVSSGAGLVIIDHVNGGTGLQSLTVMGTPTNAVVNIPAFTPGTTAPVTVTFSIIDPTQPIDVTLRAASTFHAANIRARCVTIQMREPEK